MYLLRKLLKPDVIELLVVAMSVANKIHLSAHADCNNNSGNYVKYWRAHKVYISKYGDFYFHKSRIQDYP